LTWFSTLRGMVNSERIWRNQPSKRNGNGSSPDPNKGNFVLVHSLFDRIRL
jgi:hypothetical protein